MSSFPADIAIWIFLLAGVGFSGIGLVGLLLFPDIRSRRYTSVRATLIGFSATALAAMIYGAFELSSTGSMQYEILLGLVLLLICIIFAGNLAISREILSQAIKNTCGETVVADPRNREE